MAKARTKAKTKSAGVAVFLALFVGALGFSGVGHIYLGRFGKGLFILLASWALTVVGLVFFLSTDRASLTQHPPRPFTHWLRLLHFSSHHVLLADI